MGAKFLNIELEVVSSSDLSSLAKGFGNKFLLNFCGQPDKQGDHILSGNILLENWDYQQNGHPDSNEIALGICDLIENLGSADVLLWNDAKDRVFDVGLEANFNPEVVVNLLQPSTISRIAKLGARIAVSVYTTEIESIGH